ncbi:MAG: hypothetical protein U9N34_07500, partial [Candidatus Cloacimonadota bacterium]|nr:hypothetical protein [Candidatus Cloacimonadota bacterium]
MTEIKAQQYTENFETAKAKKLLTEVNTFFRDRLNIALPNICDKTKKNGVNRSSNLNIIQSFIIPENKQYCPVYEKIQRYSDIEDVLTDILKKSEKMTGDIEGLIDDNADGLDKNTSKALDMILNHVLKFNKTYGVRKKKELSSDSIDVNELQEEIYTFLHKIIKKNFIDRVMPAIFMGLKSDHQTIYEMVLKIVNSFIVSLGIHTTMIHIGEKVDF